VIEIVILLLLLRAATQQQAVSAPRTKTPPAAKSTPAATRETIPAGSVKLEQGTTYEAGLDLPFFVPPSVAVSRLETAGFSNVITYDVGAGLKIRGTWSKPTTIVALPPQIKNPRPVA